MTLAHITCAVHIRPIVTCTYVYVCVCWACTPVSSSKTDAPTEMRFGLRNEGSCAPKEPRWSAHWRHLVYAIERSVYGGDASVW